MGDDSEGEATQQRRLRTKFTSEQVSKLAHTFSKQKYLGATQRRKIAEELNLSETQVCYMHAFLKASSVALQSFPQAQADKDFYYYVAI